VLGHDHVSDQCKFTPAANLIQNLRKTIAGAHGSQVGPLPVTTERHKMKIAPSVKSLQRIALVFHRSSSKSKPAPLGPKGAAPACTLAANREKYANDILLPCGQGKKENSMRHPPGLTGLPVDAKVAYDNPNGTRIVQGRITIHTSPDEDRIMDNYIYNAVRDPGEWQLFGRNCSRFVEEVLRKAGVDTSDAVAPRNLIKDLHRMHDTDGAVPIL